MWQQRLPREAGEPKPPLSFRSLLGRVGGRWVVAAVPLLVVAAVVFGGFGFTTVGEILAAAVLLILAVAALHPLWHRSRNSAGNWWR